MIIFYFCKLNCINYMTIIHQSDPSVVYKLIRCYKCSTSIFRTKYMAGSENTKLEKCRTTSVIHIVLHAMQSADFHWSLNLTSFLLQLCTLHNNSHEVCNDAIRSLTALVPCQHSMFLWTMCWFCVASGQLLITFDKTSSTAVNT